MKTSTRLRQLLKSDRILFRPGIGLAIHALMAEALGFEFVTVSGAQTSLHILGLPDAGLITMTEVAENVRRISTAVNIPVVADCDTGFGNAINVRRTVREIISAGAAGLFFEDQVSPKRCGFVRGKEVVPVEEAVMKFAAAAQVRDELDPDFIIIARTDARGAVGGSLEEAIARGKAYRDAGADVVYLEALKSVDEIKVAAKAIGKPFFCTFVGLDPAPTLEELESWGICTAGGSMLPNIGLMKIWDLLAEIKKEGIAPYHNMIADTKGHPLGEFGVFDLTGFPRIQQLEREFLPAETVNKKSLSQGFYDPGVGHSRHAQTAEGFFNKKTFSL